MQQYFAAKIKFVMFCYFRSCVLLQVHAQLAVSFPLLQQTLK